MIFDWFGLDVQIDPMDGVLAAVAFLAGVVFVRFLIAYANARGDSRRDESPLREALGRTGQWTWGLAAGIGSAAAIGLIQFGDIIGGAINFVVGHPYFASNFGIAGLGAGHIHGLFTLTTSQFVGIALFILGAVFIATEVDDAV